MATSPHSVLVLLVLAAVLAPISVAWSDCPPPEYPPPGHGGGASPPPEYPPPGHGGEASPPHHGKPPKHHRPPPYKCPPCNPPPYTPPYTPPPYVPSPPYNPPSMPYSPPYTPPYSPPYAPPYTPPYSPPYTPPPYTPPYTPPPARKTCPIEAPNLSACADALGDPVIGKEAKAQCCAELREVGDTDAAVCLCAAARNRDYLPVELKIKLLLVVCGKKPPLDFECPPPDSPPASNADRRPRLRA